MRRKLLVQEGGALNRVPKPSTDLQEDKAKVNSPTDLAKFMQFYSIVGHGAIPPRDKGTLFLVPERTYIMFIARAGEPTEKIKPMTDAILDGFRYKKPDASKPTGVEDDKTWYERTYTAMENGSLFRDLLYDLSKADNSKRISVYQPGDLVQNLVIDIENTSPPWDPVGIWELPMMPQTAKKLEKVRSDFIVLQDALYAGKAKQIVDRIKDFFNDKLSEATAIALSQGNTLNAQMEMSRKQFELQTIEDFVLNFHKKTPAQQEEIVSILEPQHGPSIMGKFTASPENKLFVELWTQLKEEVLKLAQDNMINQTAFDAEPKNLISHLQFVSFFKDPMNPRRSTIYDLIQERPSIAFENYAMKKPYPLYRFFIFDICRSLQEKPYPVVKRLVRTLSNVMRFNENAYRNQEPSASTAASSAAGAGASAIPTSPQFSTLLKLTRKEIKKMIESAPSEKEKNPILAELLAGREITYKNLEQLFGSTEQYEGAFEEFVKYHRFNIGDKAIVKFDVPPLKNVFKAIANKEVRIESFRTIQATSGGTSFFYGVKEKETDKPIFVSARQLWKSEKDYMNGILEREFVKIDKKMINEAIAQQEKLKAERDNQEKFNETMASAMIEIPGLRPLKLREKVKITGISGPGAPIELNNSEGVIQGAVLKLISSGYMLQYEVILATGPQKGETKKFPYTVVVPLSTFGGRRKSKTSKRRKHRKQTRRASK